MCLMCGCAALEVRIVRPSHSDWGAGASGRSLRPDAGGCPTVSAAATIAGKSAWCGRLGGAAWAAWCEGSRLLCETLVLCCSAQWG